MKKIKTLVPTHERLLIKPIEEESITESGLIITSDLKDPPTYGTVIQIGEMVHKYMSNINPGDDVMYIKYSGLDVEINGENLKLVMVNDVLGKIEY
jgi:chaperonin GroES